jgi:hypothetical protein
MLRVRDIVAVLMAVWLVQMAWNDEHDFLSASLHLAFYTRGNQHSVAPFDLDGDGTVEALVLAVPLDNKGKTDTSTSWQMEILDLKPLHKSSSSSFVTPPFRPKTIMTSAPITTDSKPLKLTTGQIKVRKRHADKRIVTLTEHEESESDRSRHFFCGKDWHDAATNCHKHCPSGTSTDCDEGHMCYADTPCDALLASNPLPDASQEDLEKLQLTPSGGLPSIVSLWSDGTVRLHSLTADKDSSKLELREMWSTSVSPLQPGLLPKDIYDLLLLGAEDVSPLSSKKQLGQYGMVIVGGTHAENSIIQALDVVKGNVIWDSHDHVLQQENKTTETPIRGATSFARRRSRLVSTTETAQEVALPNCWMAYRHSLLEEALPFGYWGPADANWRAVHLDHAPKKPTNLDSQKNYKHKWHPHRRRKGPIYGKPNVLLSHSNLGLHVRSIKNGKAICHLSLLDHVLYEDLNHDGTLDQLQVVTSDNVPDSHHNEWIANLASQIGNAPGGEMSIHRKMTATSRLCHVIALSGLPAREELFVGQLCGPSYARDRSDHASIELFAAPPLVTRTSKKTGADVVVALSNGMVSKFNIASGRKLWQVNLQQLLSDNFPTWSADRDSALTASIHVARVPFAQGPILLSGENSMVILAAGNGKVLASSVFPQTSRARPILADLSGDGITDVIIASNDALWGYQIVVQTGASVLFRIMVGLLLMAMALALLRNRFGQRSDKRSTDE